MKKSILKKILSTALAAVVGITFMPTAESMTANAADLLEQGTHEGLDWELWNQDNQGTVNMELSGIGGFTAEWSDTLDSEFSTGKIWKSEQPEVDSMGDIRMHYAVSDFESDGVLYFGAHGWTQENRVEFFIIENFNDWRPPGDNAKLIDSITVDDHIYDVYEIYNSISPVEPIDIIPKYFSVRREGDTSMNGNINVSEHFRQWEKLGLDIGSKLYQVSFAVTPYNSSGYADVQMNYMTIGGEPVNDVKPTIEVTPLTSGKHNGLDWELYKSDVQTNADMKLNDLGGFTVNWNNNNSLFHARTGKIWESDYPKLSELGDIRMHYAVKHEQINTTTIGAYGWTIGNNCNYEFNIIEHAVSYEIPGEYVGTTTVNNCVYDVYKYVHPYDSGISSDRVISYYAYRRNSENVGNAMVDVSQHFRQWKELGLEIGTLLRDVTICVSSTETTGSAEVKCIYMTIGGVAVNTNAKPDWIDNFGNETVIRGDMNNDGEIDIFDIPLMRNAVLNSSAKSTVNASADIDGDGNVAINDAVLLSQYVHGKISSFPAA